MPALSCFEEMVIFRKLLLIQICVLVFQTAAYYGSELFQHNPHNVKGRTDDLVPLIPAWVYVYVLWFPLIAFFPIALFYSSKELYVLYMASIIADVIISVTAYIAYPTSFERRKPEKSFFGSSLSIVYFFSYKGYNCAPSMHCSMCFIIMAAAVQCPDFNIAVKISVCIIAMLIVISTQFTKQHTLIDVVTAVPAAALSLIAGRLVIKAFPAAVLIAKLGL